MRGNTKTEQEMKLGNKEKNTLSIHRKKILLSLLLSSAITITGCGQSYEEKRAQNLVHTTFKSLAANKDIENKTNGFYNDDKSNHMYYLYNGSYREECDETTLLYAYSGSWGATEIFCTSDSNDSKIENDYESLGNLREYILNNDIEPIEYKFIEKDGAYIDFNQEYKDSIINNYGSEIWEYLRQNGILVPVFHKSTIIACIDENEHSLDNNKEEVDIITANEDSLDDIEKEADITTTNEDNNLKIINHDDIEECKILEQEVENDFYIKDSVKMAIKIKDNYQYVYSNYFLYSCGENLTISDSEDISIVEEDFRRNGTDEEVQLLGSLKDYIVENEIKSIGYTYEELSSENEQAILDAYGEDIYNYYKEKGYPIICFDSEKLYETYKNSLKEDEPLFLHLSKKD